MQRKPVSIEIEIQPAGPGCLVAVFVAEGCAQRGLLDVNPPEKRPAGRDKDRGHRVEVERAEAEAEEDEERIGVGWVADIAVGAGGDQSMILRDGDG